MVVHYLRRYGRRNCRWKDCLVRDVVYLCGVLVSGLYLSVRWLDHTWHLLQGSVVKDAGCSRLEVWFLIVTVNLKWTLFGKNFGNITVNFFCFHQILWRLELLLAGILFVSLSVVCVALLVEESRLLLCKSLRSDLLTQLVLQCLLFQGSNRLLAWFGMY